MTTTLARVWGTVTSPYVADPDDGDENHRSKQPIFQPKRVEIYADEREDEK